MNNSKTSKYKNGGNTEDLITVIDGTALPVSPDGSNHDIIDITSPFGQPGAQKIILGESDLKTLDQPQSAISKKSGQVTKNK